MVAESSTDLEYRFVPESPPLEPQTPESILETVESFQGRYIIPSGSLPTGTPVETYATMARFARRRNKRFVLGTSGAEGAIIASSTGVRRLTTPDVPVRSAVGAGDSFIGGFVSSLVRGETVDEALLMASAAGDAAVMTPGTELCKAEDAESLRTKVQFE